MAKDKLFILFAGISVISLIFFIASLNGLLFQNPEISKLINLNKLGSWQYWIIVISVIIFIYFAYETSSYISDIFKFNRMINTESKKTFMKNLPELEGISKRFGGSYKTRLNETKKRWNIKTKN